MSEKLNKNGKPYAPTLAVMFDAPEFGLDATEDTPEEQIVTVTLRSGEVKRKIIGTAFRTKKEGLSQNDFEQIQKHLQIGTGLLLRAGSKLNAAGGRNFYLEPRPNYAPAQNYNATTFRANPKPKQQDDGI